MPLLLRNLRLDLEEPEETLLARAAKRLRVEPGAIRHWAIVRRSIDARRRRDVHFSYHVEVALHEPPHKEKARLKRLRPQQAAWIEPAATIEPVPGQEPLPERPIIVGFGPGGMFAALRLAEAGYKPIVLERGYEVRRRHRDIMKRFYRERDFDPSSNLLYGEGGAGTYSDGKLYTRVSDPLTGFILQKLYQFGASPDILIDARPHIGSDRLPRICWNIREHIRRQGGEVRFGSVLADVRMESARLRRICIAPSDAPATERANLGAWRDVGPLVLAVGHSARDTMSMLVSRGVTLEPKPFQIGVRIEHPQRLIDGWQYGTAAGHARLGAAEYHLVAKQAAPSGGDMFSFCMCPGGVILPTNEDRGLVATNGASKAKRGSPFANSGLVITMHPADMGLDALGALAFQRMWEERAFEMTGGTYEVPAQRAADYLNRAASDGALQTSYPLGGRWCDIRQVVPGEVAAALDRALVILNDRFDGFAGQDAIIAAPETRASAPIRMLRDRETRESVSAAGLYPVGEGAGYAGGIVSAAIDGVHAADKIIERYAAPAS